MRCSWSFSVKHNGNVSLDEIISIARQLKGRSYAKALVGCVKEILGTCNSVGCTVDGKSPRDITAQINSGSIEVPVGHFILFFDLFWHFL